MTKKKIIGVIPARMASSRFYGKPLAKICGKEMIQWVYENSKASTILKDIYIATDHDEIAAFCRKEDIAYIMTSPDHKNCSERTDEVCGILGADFVVEIQGDEPVLTADEIDSFITRSFEYKNFDVTLSYTDVAPELAENKQIVKLVLDKDSRALFFSRSCIPQNFKLKHVNYYKQIGLYLWNAAALKRFSETPVGYLESIEDTHTLRLVENHFDAIMVYSPKDTIGVDGPGDIAKVEEFIRQGKLS
jgi:3-deoxy-manno-octulosonate cytidylyltransferase (CMP-KDO synthetase)